MGGIQVNQLMLLPGKIIIILYVYHLLKSDKNSYFTQSNDDPEIDDVLSDGGCGMGDSAVHGGEKLLV